MTKTYRIDKRTPNLQWYTIYRGLDADTAVTMLTDIVLRYDSMSESQGDRAEIEANLLAQLDAESYAATSVDDGEDDERGDLIGYRIVEEGV